MLHAHVGDARLRSFTRMPFLSILGNPLQALQSLLGGSCIALSRFVPTLHENYKGYKCRSLTLQTQALIRPKGSSPGQSPVKVAGFALRIVGASGP